MPATQLRRPPSPPRKGFNHGLLGRVARWTIGPCGPAQEEERWLDTREASSLASRPRRPWRGWGRGVAGLKLRARAPHPGRRRPTPDLVLLNARVLTSDDAQPRAEAFAVKQGRFTAVGSSDDIANLKTARSHVIDGVGQTIVPGFTIHTRIRHGAARSKCLPQPRPAQPGRDQAEDPREGRDDASW